MMILIVQVNPVKVGDRLTLIMSVETRNMLILRKITMTKEADSI